MLKKNILKISVLFVLLFVCSLTKTYAACDPQLDPFCTVDTDDPNAPLDNGVIFLICITGIIGIYAIKSNQKKQLL